VACQIAGDHALVVVRQHDRVRPFQRALERIAERRATAPLTGARCSLSTRAIWYAGDQRVFRVALTWDRPPSPLLIAARRAEGFRVNWGDPWSDGNALTSGRYFARDGFAATGMTPVLDVGPLTPDSLRYTHYPPLPDLVNGVQQRVVGTMSIGGFRLLADLLSLLSLVFFYRFVRRFTSAAVAGYAVLLVGTNLLWLQYADTLHHVPLHRAGYAALDQVGAWTERPARRRLAVILIATTLCALASYDFGLYLPIMTVAAVVWSGRRLRDRESWPVMMAVGAGLILGVVVKFALIAWAVGPVHLVHDLLFQFEERATARHSTNYTAGLMPIVSARLWRFFTPLFLVLLLAGPWLAWRRRRTGVDAPVALRPLVSGGGVPFCVVFPQLLVEQFHPHAAVRAVLRGRVRRDHRRDARACPAGASARGLVLAAFLPPGKRELVRFPRWCSPSPISVRSAVTWRESTIAALCCPTSWSTGRCDTTGSGTSWGCRRCRRLRPTRTFGTCSGGTATARCGSSRSAAPPTSPTTSSCSRCWLASGAGRGSLARTRTAPRSANGWAR
jgi:hypothetical protein